MQTTVRFLVGLVLLTALTTFAQTNTNTIPVFTPLDPVLKLLPVGLHELLTKVVVWIGSFGLVLAPFSVWIQHKLTDFLNTAAASKDVDDDVWLAKLFKASWYRVLATGLRFLHLRLPTIADLERALDLQAEADTVKTTKPLR